MEWPVFFRESLLIGDKCSNVGICTLWTKKEVIAGNVSSSDYAVCGNLYTVQGINPMLKNILANPRINTIVFCGADLMRSGDAFFSFVANGIDAERKIIGSYGYIDSDIGESLVLLLRKNVRIVDMRGKEREIGAEVKKLRDGRGPFMEPVVITTSEETAPSMGSEETSYRVDGSSIREAWLKMIDIIMKFGADKPTEYNTKQKEILNLTAVIDSEREHADERVESYYRTFFSRDVPPGVTYTYGNRIYGYDIGSGKKFDQAAYVVDRLRENRSTRRAFISMWNIGSDSDKSNHDPPCIVSVSFSIRGGKLYETAVIRSNDIFGAWPYNASALRRLQREIASKVGVDVGSLTTISISAHIYENNWLEASGVVGREYTGKVMPFVQDRNGYFVIEIRDNEIVVEHRVNDGRRSNFTFRGAKAQPLYRQILHENLITKFDHAAYIGHELARAEICLKENKKFYQDEA